ncbi:MAG: YHS domain-containing (seleno)protein [Bacteroidota bacterium]
MKTLTFVLLIAVCWTVGAQNPPPHPYASPETAVAFDGYDLTSYFAGKTEKGTQAFETKYDGLTLRFVSEANQKAFLSNPDKYLPAYGGWCAIALTQGSWVEPNFAHFKIQEGKLLFFEVRAFFNGKTAWEKDPDINMIMADRKYQEMLAAE